VVDIFEEDEKTFASRLTVCAAIAYPARKNYPPKTHLHILQKFLMADNF